MRLASFYFSLRLIVMAPALAITSRKIPAIKSLIRRHPKVLWPPLFGMIAIRELPDLWLLEPKATLSIIWGMLPLLPFPGAHPTHGGMALGQGAMMRKFM